MRWINNWQIKGKFKEDLKIEGFEDQQNDFDKLLWAKDKNKITKVYKALLNRDLEIEEIKYTMIKWAKDIGRNIDLEKWENAPKESLG